MGHAVTGHKKRPSHIMLDWPAGKRLRTSPCPTRRKGWIYRWLEKRLVPLAGLEPALLAEPHIECGASTNFTTGACIAGDAAPPLKRSAASCQAIS